MKASAINVVYIPLARLSKQGHRVCACMCMCVRHVCAKFPVYVGVFTCIVLKLTMQGHCVVCAFVCT